MKKLSIFASLAVTSLLYAQDFSITNNWQLLGATEDLNISAFDGKCVDFLWKYDAGWQVHIANGLNYTIPSTIPSIASINKGDGFWVKGNGVCDFSSNLSTEYVAFTNDMIQNKTFYVVGEDSFEKYQLVFAIDSYSYISGNENGSDNFNIESDGMLNLGSDAPLVKLISIDNSEYYQIQEIRVSNGEWNDETGWFDSSNGGTTVASFNNDINALKDYFLTNGLWETTITSDGKINKYNDNTKVDGKWWIEDGIFYFDYPDNETGGLDSKAYKLENNTLYFATDAKYTHNARLYFDESKAMEYYNSLVSTDENNGVLDFTDTMLDNKSYYLVFQANDYNTTWGAFIVSFADGNRSLYDGYDYNLGESSYTIEDGQLKYNSFIYPDTKYTYDLTKNDSDPIEFNMYATSISTNELLNTFSGKWFESESDAKAYQQSLEVYDNDFFASSVSFTKPTVIQHVDMSGSYVGTKTKFDNGGISGNSYDASDTGVTLTAVPVSGINSRMKGNYSYMPYQYNGFAIQAQTQDLDANRYKRVRLYFNAYNDGTQDIQGYIQIMKDKVVYWQWQSETADTAQTLTSWVTVLDASTIGGDFSNKTVNLATWVNKTTGKLCFYAECEGNTGYQEFDINEKINNPLEGSHWMRYDVENRNGATDNTVAKFTKLNIIR